MSSLSSSCRLIVVLAVAAFAASASFTVEAARAEEPAETVSESTRALLDEIAGALGFADSDAQGFSEAYAEVRREELAELEQQRAEGVQQLIADALLYGRRIEGEAIDAGGGVTLRFFEELVPAFPGDIESPVLLRKGEDHIDELGRITRTTDYYDSQGTKVVATVTSIISGGKEKIVQITGNAGALDVKVGDTRPALIPTKSGAGEKPRTLDPKSDGSFGRASGDYRNPQNAQPASDDASKDETQAAKPDAASGANESAQSSSSGGGSSTGQTSSSSGESQSQYVYLGQGPERQNEDGSTSQNTLYQRTEDGVYVQTVTTTQKDGSQTQEQNCFKDSQEVACDGRTDEPSCRIDCARLALLIQLFFCTSGGGGGSECGSPPEGMRPSAAAGTDAPCGDQSAVDFSSDSEAEPHDSAPRTDGTLDPDCTNADAPGGPIDYGDPTDPNGEEPPDVTWLLHLLNDGVSDPVNPGEPEEVVESSARLDMYGTLHDPVGPPGTEEEDTIPGGGPPSTGEAERQP